MAEQNKYEPELRRSHVIATSVMFFSWAGIVVLGFMSLKGWEEVLEPLGLHLFMNEWSWFIDGLYRQEHKVIYSWVYVVSFISGGVAAALSWKGLYYGGFLKCPKCHIRMFLAVVIIFAFYPGNYEGRRAEFLFYSGFFSYVLNGAFMIALMYILWAFFINSIVFMFSKEQSRKAGG